MDRHELTRISKNMVRGGDRGHRRSALAEPARNFFKLRRIERHASGMPKASKPVAGRLAKRHHRLRSAGPLALSCSLLQGRNDSDPRVAVANQPDYFLRRAFKGIVRLTEIEPLCKIRMRLERGEALDQRSVALLIGAHEHPAPGLRVRAEAQDHPAMKIDCLRTEHRPQNESGIALQRLP